MKFSRYEKPKTLETVFEIRLSAHEMLSLYTKDPDLLASKSLTIPEIINRLYAASLIIQGDNREYLFTSGDGASPKLGKHKLSDAELMNEFSANIDKFWGDVNSVLTSTDNTDEHKSRMSLLYEMARRFHNRNATGGKSSKQ